MGSDIQRNALLEKFFFLYDNEFREIFSLVLALVLIFFYIIFILNSNNLYPKYNQIKIKRLKEKRLEVFNIGVSFCFIGSLIFLESSEIFQLGLISLINLLQLKLVYNYRKLSDHMFYKWQFKVLYSFLHQALLFTQKKLLIIQMKKLKQNAVGSIYFYFLLKYQLKYPKQLLSKFNITLGCVIKRNRNLINQINSYLINDTIILNQDLYDQTFFTFTLKHKKDVSTLNFFNYNSDFVSGSQSVIIWPLSLISNQKYIQKISGHAKMIQCLALHPSEFLIVSGPSDTTIQFWFNQEQQLNNQTITDHKDSVFDWQQIKKEIEKCLVERINNRHHPFWQVRQTITSNEYNHLIQNHFHFKKVKSQKKNIEYEQIKLIKRILKQISILTLQHQDQQEPIVYYKTCIGLIDLQ
ncbi:unnamed protein product [Paramecium octaurelia]|uniref:Transmembrane protein n=1 Tax=Paramecium octaurelia TaxID=43137 RepID=A0A8S1YQY6_PAROT|nr:unnamed protein product [Paramecium octaurelia]